MGKYETKGAKPSRKLWIWLSAILVVVLLVGAAGFFMLKDQVYFVDGRPVLLSSKEIDLREAEVSVDEYLDLKTRCPEAKILWSIPICGTVFESDSPEISIDRLTEADIALLAYFTDLQKVDARGCSDHALLQALEKTYPQLDVDWAIHLDGIVYERDAQIIDLSLANVSADALSAALPYFAPGRQFLLSADVLSADDVAALQKAFPDQYFSWQVTLMGKSYASDTENLSFAGGTVDVQSLVDAAPLLTAVTAIDLTDCGCSVDELLDIKSAYPNATLLSELTLCGQSLSTDVTEIDLSGIQMENADAIEKALPLFSNLQKVIMSDCGISNEDMDALNKRHENVKFVWTVYFSVYSLRTDATVFIASNLPEYGYHAMKLNSQQLQPLRYCTDLIALDLGHMPFEDLSFLEEMYDLQYLIMVENRFHDISVLAQMEDLYYLEIFNNVIDDISPLLECKKLRHLNVGYTKGYDITPLTQMTYLERLWYPCNFLTEAQKQQIASALPNTEIYMPGWDNDGCTGGTWRTVDAYYEMRNVFNMFYQPPGTGMHNDDD